MPVRLLILVVVVFLSLATWSSSRASQGPDTVPSPEPTPLRILPSTVLNAELRATGGSSFRLSDYSRKILVVSLWATWCTPCRFETPALVKLHKQFESQAVQIVELSTENPDNSAAEVREWVRNYAVPYSVGWATPEVALTLMQGRDAIPQTFVISRSGRIVRRFVGFNRKTIPSQLKQAIQEALNEESDLPEQN